MINHVQEIGLEALKVTLTDEANGLSNIKMVTLVELDI